MYSSFKIKRNKEQEAKEKKLGCSLSINKIDLFENNIFSILYFTSSISLVKSVKLQGPLVNLEIF
jgi:hypothetical protein